ncbi:MAG: ATP-binding cassette domain-containing protein, partial [Deltaproteobacteria bacterium]|nr:ATP-binding cassette domain-containing protein [Deltaproteobacteria bacterium]
MKMKVSFRDIHKHYGALRANDGIDMDVEAGTIHGILGENGAGKSTLMKILAGYVRRTAGSILLDGKPVDYNGPKEATSLGIGMLYQDPLDFPSLSVLENYMIGQARGFGRKKSYFRGKLKESAAHFGFNVDPDRPVESLSVGERQQLEILRLMAIGVRVLILDEPTTGISRLQREILFRALKRLVDEGKTVLFVSHKLEDVEAFCDRVTILRKGRVRGEMSRPLDTEKILRWMFGSLPLTPPCPRVTQGPPSLLMKDLSVSLGRVGLYQCDVEIRAGEVVGLAGLEGSGQGIFLRVAAGLIRPDRGLIRVGERPMTGGD